MQRDNNNPGKISNVDEVSKSAFVSLVGCPNVGKSSILNIILGQKISIVSPKPQTTRNRILGVLTKNGTQLVFTDTPGLHKPLTKLGEFMVKSAEGSVLDSDICVLVVPAGQLQVKNQELSVINKLKSDRENGESISAILVINKVDTIKDKSVLINQIQLFCDTFNFDEIIPVSAKTGEGIDTLVSEINKRAVPSYHFFDDDMLTDQPERTIASEIIREKLLRFLDKEIPHGTAVFVEKMSEREKNSEPLIDIDATIFCEKPSHKGIIIGKNGSMLKKIATLSREDMERFFDSKVNLKVWVKVKEDWRNRDNILRGLGFDNKLF